MVDITFFSITPNSFYNVIHWTCQSNSQFIRRENYYLENHIFFFQMSWKDDLSKKIVLEFDLSCIIGKDYISFSQKYGFIPDGKQKMIFLKKKKKNTRKHIYFKCSKKMVFSKRIATGYDLSCTIWKGGIFFLENMVFFPWMENERAATFLKKYTETWYFLFDMFHAPMQKTNQRWSYAKIHLNVIDMPDRPARKSSSNSLYLHGDLYRRFHILLSSKKNKTKQET